jgi:Domain of unknown function (DUF4389)
MSTATPAHPLPAHPSPRWGPGRALALVAGSLVGLIALALMVAGLALVLAHVTVRDSAGFYTSPVERFTTDTYAISSQGLQIGDVRGHGANWALDALDPTVRVRASAPAGRPVFIGIAAEADVDRYLVRSAHAEISGVHGTPFSYDAVRHGGAAPPGVPTAQTFWVASASGWGTQAVKWTPTGGRWAVVVMNADGSRQVTADVSAGAKSDLVLPVGVVLLTAGILALVAATSLIWFGTRGPSAPSGGATAVVAGTTAAHEYPLHLEARLDEPLSRGLWLVKWLLALPHWIALAFLWVAFDVLTLVALVAILFTGRYPRALFDFNVGVLRWTWRVVDYALALGTDRYPPFTLAPADYPAELDVPYPERLSRGKAFFKPWLLALPQWCVVAIFLGWWRAPGLLPLLAVIGGAVLLFTGRYPRDIFGLVTALSRWVARVAVFAGLMRDEYPPFRLDR